jgi:hypothetical protein
MTFFPSLLAIHPLLLIDWVRCAGCGVRGVMCTSNCYAGVTIKIFPYPCYYLCRSDNLFSFLYLIVDVMSVEKTLAYTFDTVVYCSTLQGISDQHRIQASRLKVQIHWEIGVEQRKEHAHNFLWHKGDCSQRICSVGPKSQFLIPLWRLMASACKCAKTSFRTLATNELAFASRQRSAIHFLFHNEFLTRSNMSVVPHPPYFSIFPIEDKTERPPYWHNWGDRGRMAGGAEHPHRSRPQNAVKNGQKHWERCTTVSSMNEKDLLTVLELHTRRSRVRIPTRSLDFFFSIYVILPVVLWFLVYSVELSWVYLTADGQSTSSSWYRAPLWGPWPDFILSFL